MDGAYLLRIAKKSTLALLVAVALSGCLSANDTGATEDASDDEGTAAGADTAPSEDSATVQETATAMDTATSGPVGVDFLFVVNNSASSCNELQAFTDQLPRLIQRVMSRVDIDPRVAVTGDDIGCDPDEVEAASSAQGRFNPAPAHQWPPPCREHRFHRCQSDADCAHMDCVERGDCLADDPTCTCEGQSDAWACQGYPSTCAELPNGAPGTRCVRRCTTDEECRTAFADARFVCGKPSRNAADWSCLLPPPTDGCPETLPPFLDADHLDLLPCVASLEINQFPCMEHESAFRTAFMALDPTGPNAAQAQAFRRPDAFLVVVFVSDEDDCSAAEGEYVGEDWVYCPTLATTDEGGPLLPVETASSRLGSLVEDPSRLIVAAVAGDTVATNPDAANAEREAFLDIRRDTATCSGLTYICASEDGPAGYGWRYQQLIAAFGPNGAFVNICGSPDGAYDAVADHIIEAVKR